MNVKNFREIEAWYKSRFGLITSDEINLGSPDRVLGAFLRCDRGSIPSDHHTLFLLGTGKVAFDHAAYEVADFDDLMFGHYFLKQHGRRHEWVSDVMSWAARFSITGATHGSTHLSIGPTAACWIPPGARAPRPSRKPYSLTPSPREAYWVATEKFTTGSPVVGAARRGS